jgi:3-oxoadipate enol-lactonase
MPHLESNGIRLHYQVQGDGPPLVLAHGYAASSAMWRHQLPVLLERYRVITYDARGHGESDAPDGAGHYTLRELVADLHRVLDALGLQQAHLVGHSMGGATVAAYAAREPGRVRSCAICNIDAGHQRWTPEQERDHEAARQWKLDFARTQGMEALAREQIARGVAPAFVTAREGEEALFLERYRRQPLAGYLGVAEALPWREHWLEGESVKIKAPVLIVAGGDDPLHTGARSLHEALPGSGFVLLPGAPHDSMNDSPDEFNQALLAFLAGVDAQTDLAAPW